MLRAASPLRYHPVTPRLCFDAGIQPLQGSSPCSQVPQPPGPLAAPRITASRRSAGGDTTPQKQPPMLLRVLSLPTRGLEAVLGEERFLLQRLALAAGKAGLALYGLFCRDKAG